MRKVKYLLLAVMTVFAFVACNSDDEMRVESPDGTNTGEIQLDMLHPGRVTRATETAFENTDSIGVYVTAQDVVLQLGGNEVNNELFVYNGSAWASVRKVYWNTGKHNVYAYYPYSKTVNDVEDYSFSVWTDQSTANGFTRSDFMWASANEVTASSNPVKMQFAHKMSNVVVKLEKGENFEGNVPSDAEVYLYSTVISAVVDLSTGDVAKDNYASESTIRCRKLSDTEFTAIVVPQSITSRRPLVEVVIGGVSYLMEGKISYKQGYRHTVVVTLDQDPEKIKINLGGQIDNWN